MKLDNMFGEHISKLGLKQLRIAETEKYAHVTYFFNGGIEKPWPNEDRKLIPSVNVKTYNLQPAMSAAQITEQIIQSIADYDIIICNYANADMVGHTGDLPATINAIETIDNCLGQLLKSINHQNGTMLITADHGNAEDMFNPKTNQPHTAHTNNFVPCILTNPAYKKNQTQGHLIDIAPTILAYLQLPQPKQMTGKPLFAKSN